MKNQLYSNGKLLLTGEYAILDGATGLALPTTFGQFLTLGKTASDTLDWVSLDENDDSWFRAEFSRIDFRTINTTDTDIANRLAQILGEAKRLNPNFLLHSKDFNAIEAKLTFPRHWGLGSSSTLVANIAQWAKVNPYRLLAGTFGGSGYDIACAGHGGPILYQNRKYTPRVREVDFRPVFSDNLFFVYLNQKKNSRDAIKTYSKLEIDKNELILKIDDITQRMIHCKTISEFEDLLDMHEHIISKALHIATIKEDLFTDFPGSLKSLGAWGGDFIMATGTNESMSYFRSKGYNTILSYKEMIK